MPGDGTRTVTITNNPPARCLDLTRLISRVGRGPKTGIDRVEYAYLKRLLDDYLPLFLLVRTGLGFILLDNQGASEVLARIEGQTPWGGPDLVSQLSRKASPAKRRAEADLRRFSIDRCRKGRLAAMLRRALPEGCTYLNTGHSNLTDEALGARGYGQVSVLIHDTIPLDFPQFQRPGTPALFEAKLKSVARNADLVICNSRQTEADVVRWFAEWGMLVPTMVAHLGVDARIPDPQTLPDIFDPNSPYFVTLGTIEPRKNHALLLDIWEGLAGELSQDRMPKLYIIGARGWANEELFQRLDSSPVMGSTVFELSGLADGAVFAAIAGAAGVLFPSRAEGYGLPPAEAIALGTPVICANLPVYDEILGNIPVYLAPDDVYLWKQSILRMAEEKRAGQTKNAGAIPETGIPTWADHFNLVLKVT